MVVIKRVSAFFTLVGILIIVYFLTMFFTISPAGSNFSEWKQLFFILDLYWKEIIGFVIIFICFTLISAMHTLAFSDISIYEKEINKITDEYNQKLTELETKINEYENINKKITSQLEFSSNEVINLKQNIQILQKELSEKNEAYFALSKDLENYKIKFEEANKSLIEANDKVSRIEAEYKQLEYNYKKLQEELEKTKLSSVEKPSNLSNSDYDKSLSTIPDSAFQILYMLQKDGRLIDFLSEDITEVSDEQLGAAVRPLHENLRKILKERLIVEPILDSAEGEEVTIPENYDINSIKLIGNVSSSGPYKGVLIHKGWRLKECNLPSLIGGWKGNVIIPAEIEVL